MKTMTASLATLLALTLNFHGAARAQDGPVGKPASKVGDTRTVTVYDAISRAPRHVDELVVAVVTDERTEVRNLAREQALVYDGDMALQRLGDFEYAPPLQHLKFPLAPGQRWQHGTEFTHPTCGKTSWKLENTVAGWETVKVPAGSFRALRVDSKGRWKNSCGGDELSFVFWYAPEVRGTVRSEFIVYARGKPVDATYSVLTNFKLVE